jgi:hypothetical protein
MSMQGKAAFHPNGERIIGTLESLEGRANVNPGTFSRDEDGSLDFEYQGETEVYGDSQSSKRENGERVFISEHGSVCRSSEVLLGRPIEAKVYGTHIMTSQESGTPSATFDARPAVEQMSVGMVANMYEENDLGSGYATDYLARAARQYDEGVEEFFTFLDSAQGLGIDLGGFGVKVQDKAELTEWISENRPEVFDGLAEEWYGKYLEEQAA